ncbi:hypothetical protein FOA52_014050 [Chlamydomonas sp. UWO 241]|nr:hypothetical protein FOA52_014050 [Chlamydomonas sp. UWO 241]
MISGEYDNDAEGARAAAAAAAAAAMAAVAEDGMMCISVPVCQAVDAVRCLYYNSHREEPAGGGAASASFHNAKPAVGGLGVEPRGGLLCVLFTVASDAVAGAVVRWRQALVAVFDVLSDREEARHGGASRARPC